MWTIVESGQIVLIVVGVIAFGAAIMCVAPLCSHFCFSKDLSKNMKLASLISECVKK